MRFAVASLMILIFWLPVKAEPCAPGAVTHPEAWCLPWAEEPTFLRLPLVMNNWIEPILGPVCTSDHCEVSQ